MIQKFCVGALVGLISISGLAQTGVAGAGATFPSAVYQSWAAKYASTSGKKISYSPTGSGDGVKKIAAREVSFGGTDTPLSDADLTKNHLVQIPTLVGGIVPVVNLNGVNSNDLRLTGDVLADIFRGQIRTWNDRRIQSINPGRVLPATIITRVVRSDKSGSTEGFTKYLELVSPAFKTDIGASSLPKWTTGSPLVAADGNDGIAKSVRATQGAIGYLSYDRVVKYGVTAVQLQSGDGTNFVSAGEEGFRIAVQASGMIRSADETTSLLNMRVGTAWPITLATFVLVDAQPKTAAAVTDALKFLYWTQLNGDSLVRNTGFAPLPSSIQAKFASRFDRIKAQDGSSIQLY